MNIEKFFRAAQAIDDNMAHANCMLDNKDYKHTLILCKDDCFSTKTMVARKHLVLKLHIHYFSVHNGSWVLIARYALSSYTKYIIFCF